MRAVMNCQICGKKNRLNEANTLLHVYTRQPAFSWCELICEHCDGHQEFFFHPTEWEPHLRAVIDSKVSVIEQEWVDDKTYGEYLETWWQGEEHTLTDQDEKNIKFLAWLLQHYDTRFFDDPERGEM